MARQHHPYTYLQDIERCPYVPKDPEYEEWITKDDERLKKISDARSRIVHLANSLMSHKDREVRDVASFTYGWFHRPDGTPR